MKFSLKMLGHGGHSEVSVDDGKISVVWKQTTEQEQKSLAAMIENAKSKGFKTPEGFEAKFDKDGSVALDGDKAASLAVISELISGEIKSGKFVCGEDGIIKSVEGLTFKEGQKIVSSKAVVGG